MKPNLEREWDAVIIGGGHAGLEAAFASARLGSPTLLLTARRNALGLMPCNPAIGGLAKSHLVFELDALGGEMPINTDMTGLQFRVLNRSRGPAVQANRVQCDKRDYTRRMCRIAETLPNLTILEDSVVNLLHTARTVTGLQTARHGIIRAKNIVLTTGTALGGVIWCGHTSTSGAGDARPAETPLATALRALHPSLEVKRLKTGTPPRIWNHSIDFSSLQPQGGETNPIPYFSRTVRRMAEEGAWKPGIFLSPQECSTWNIVENYATYRNADCEAEPDCSTWNNPEEHPVFYGARPPGEEQMPCWFTYTNAKTHAIIHDNLEKSALYGGAIEGTGVRYCPSIEDKIVKFAARDEHHVILEPEGRDCPWMYPNGLSNSLPPDVQVDMIRSIRGLERAEIAAPGYAIEYDAIDARALDQRLALKEIPNLFFAGQINGTTGYEEAAAQGFVAGVNAALAAQNREPFVLSRGEAYIGVMIDDLITKGTDEPYRMFTSRAERRLILRQDNARYRLAAHARKLGLLDPTLLSETEAWEKAFADEKYRLEKTHLSGDGTSYLQLLARPGMTYADLPPDRVGEGAPVPASPEWIAELEIEVKYAGYIQQEERAAARLKGDDALRIPSWLDYTKTDTLRFEAREKLNRVKPATLGQAGRIPGVNPADIAILSVIIKRGKPE